MIRRSSSGLSLPRTDFLNLLAMTFVSAVPEEYLDYLPDSPEFRQHTLSNGPYAITRYVQNRELSSSRNPVWDAATDPNRPAYVDRISIRLGIDDELAQLQIEAGTADLGYGPHDADGQPGIAAGDRRSAGEADARRRALRLHALPGDQPGWRRTTAVRLQRLKVRQAIALAVDKRAVAQVAGGPGVSRPLHQAVPVRSRDFAAAPTIT